MTQRGPSRRAFVYTLAIILASALGPLAGCGRGGGGGGTAANQTGRPADQARIVALSPAVAVMLRDLGLADRVVGKHDYDQVLPEHLPSVGHQEAIDYEALLRARPTDIIIEWGSRPLPPRLVELADEHGWSVRKVRLLTLDDIAKTVDDLAIGFGVVDLAGGTEGYRPPGMGTPEDLEFMPKFEDPAERMEVELPSAHLARAWSRRGDGFDGVGRVLLIASTDPIGVVGPGSFHHQILQRIGGVPAVKEGSPWMEMDAEDVLRLAPDAIVLIAPSENGAEDETQDGLGPDPEPAVVRERLGVIADLDIPAVRNGRLALIDDPLALIPSTSMAHFADRLAAILERWRGTGAESP